jgi:Inner membrane component of T3SS, cytoplasmic domain
MSFRLFVCWCALCGGWGAAAGWALGFGVVRGDSLGGTGIKGMFLGMLIALALGVVDAVWVYSLRQVGRVLPRVLVCVAVGTVGGLLGGVLGQHLFDWKDLPGLLICGWVLTGLMVGASIGTYDLLRSWVREEELGWVVWRVVRGVVGGAVGGLLGGALDWKMGAAWAEVSPDRSDLWSPSLTGFVVLGLCIGLLIGVARVALPEAWLEVEEGFRKGRQLLLAGPVLTVGRAEACDLGLFGDNRIEKLHARIYQQDGRRLIADAGTAAGTYVNGVRISGPTPLRSGDLIRVGNALLRFSERAGRAK